MIQFDVKPIIGRLTKLEDVAAMINRDGRGKRVGLVASGSIAAGSGKIDLTSTNAFAEFGVDLSAYQDGNHYLLLTGTGQAGGYISDTAPGGLTLDSELVDAFTNTVGMAYETFTPGVGSDITQAVNSAGFGMAHKSFVAVSGALYKSAATVTKASGANPNFRFISGPDPADPKTPVLDIGSGTYANVYRTAASNYTAFQVYVGSGVATDFALSGFTLKRVTDCAATGGLILGSDKTTRKWAFQETTLNPNGAMTYRIYRVY